MTDPRAQVVVHILRDGGAVFHNARGVAILDLGLDWIFKFTGPVEDVPHEKLAQLAAAAALVRMASYLGISLVARDMADSPDLTPSLEIERAAGEIIARVKGS